MSEPPPEHPEADDWAFLTDQFISSPPPAPDPFASLSEPNQSNSFPQFPIQSSSDPIFHPADLQSPVSTNPFLSSSADQWVKRTGSASDQIPSRSYSEPIFNPEPGRTSDADYWTPPQSPYRSTSDPVRTPDSDSWSPPPGHHHASSLPEFASRTSSDPIFRPAGRSAVDPARPVPLTVRPHPSRESQCGCTLRSLAFYPSSSLLWAVHESGLRVWNTNKLFDEMPKSVRKGDEETAPFAESCRTSAGFCLTVDVGRGIVWSGHVDGKIMGWSCEMKYLNEGFEQCIAWDAHGRSPVLSLVITAYGELWSGSEGGVIKVWSADCIEKSLALRKEEKHKANLLIEKSCMDLRSLVTDGGNCPLPTIDIKLLLSDNSKFKVWSGGYLSFVLWDCRTKQLLKVVNLDGPVETMSNPDPYEFSTIKREKSRGPVNFFQRSRNALLGAADAVRRVAVKAAFGEDLRKIETLALSPDGIVWAGTANGSISKWDHNGYRLHEFRCNSSSVQCISAHGTRVWVGYLDGTVQILDLEGKLLGEWLAHKSPIVKIAIGRSYAFTLANHGGIRAWNLSSPGPIDGLLRPEIKERELKYRRFEYTKMVVGTWNVGQERGAHSLLKEWLGGAVREEIGLVVVGLQEIEMGAGFLAISAAKETVGLEGSPNGDWWMDTIGQVLGGAHFERVGSRQLAGLLIAVWARKNLKQYIGDIEGAAVACGLGRAIGNKGAVGLRMRIYGRVICLVNCHFAAQMEAVSRRNEDFDHVYRTLTFSSPSTAGVSAVQFFRGVNATSNKKPDLSEADLVVFLGDLNYRADSISYEEAMNLVYKKNFERLRERDQLRTEARAGRVFQGFREGQIKFPPTYKFEKGISGISGYDQSEKKRIPAWCDRVLYRDCRSVLESSCSLDCPVVSSISLYDSCMEATDSDHKPVKCVLNVEIARVDERIRRQQLGEIIFSNSKIRDLIEQFKIVPEISISTDNIALQNQEILVFRVINKSKRDTACFEMLCGDERGGFPKWLKVTPVIGIIHPGQTVEVNLQHGDIHNQDFLDFFDRFSENRSIEENREKLTVLILSISGNYSTEAETYKIRVRHTSSSCRTGFTSKSRTFNY